MRNNCSYWRAPPTRRYTTAWYDAHAHAAGSVAWQKDRMSLSNTLRVGKTEIISHRGGKGRGNTRVSEAFRKLFAKILAEPVPKREFWFCRIVSVRSLKRHRSAVFLVNLAQLRRYQRPLESKEGSVSQLTTSVILKAQRSQISDRCFGSSPALHFLLVEALMTSPLSHNAPRLRIDIRWERQSLAPARAAVYIRV